MKATTTQILTIIQNDPFRRLVLSDLHSHLHKSQSLPDLQAENLLQKAMVELYFGD